MHIHQVRPPGLAANGPDSLKDFLGYYFRSQRYSFRLFYHLRPWFVKNIMPIFLVYHAER